MDHICILELDLRGILGKRRVNECGGKGGQVWSHGRPVGD